MAGEPSVFAVSARLLTPCLRQLPIQLKNHNVQRRVPSLNFLVNPDSIKRLKVRSRVISYLRSYLVDKDFLEMETPILSRLAGGANAKPFQTTLNAYKNLALELRIAPELHLKQLVVGGIERVFEIGKQFRNEGIDATHNPEFTTCELYQTYTSLQDMMEFTELLFKDILVKFGQKSDSAVENDAIDIDNQIYCDIDITIPFKKVWVIPALEEYFEQTLPDVESNNPSIRDELIEMCKSRNIVLGKLENMTVAKILDKMIGHVIEPKCIEPTFLLGHPIVMSPLANRLKGDQRLADRFELFIGGKEYINAYSELNNPDDQRDRFIKQSNDRTLFGDLEAQHLDEDYLIALEYGLPPTVGWGLGIDRLCMLLCKVTNIRDVLAFPLSKIV